MGIYLYERAVTEDKTCFVNRVELQLAGYKAIHTVWRAKGEPRNGGWHATADELIRAATGGEKNASNAAILFDLAPRRDWSIEMLI